MKSSTTSPSFAYSSGHHKAAATLAAALAVAGLASTASAQVKANSGNSTAMNLSGSWVSGTIPNSSTVAVFNSTLTGPSTVSLGGNATWGGIQVTNPGGAFTIASGNFLTVGASGIDLSAATNNLNINAGVITGAAQNWSINGGRSLQFGTNSSILETGGNISTSGAGTLDFRSATAGTISGVVSNTSVSVNGANTSLTLGNSANTFTSLAVAAGKVRGAVITNAGSASSFGTDNDIALGGNNQSGVFEYIGNTASTNRTFTRDARGAASGITVTQAGQTLTINGNTSSGTQINAGSNGWVFSGAGNLILNGQLNNASGIGSTGTTITKTGTGTLTLAGTNNTTGNVTVSAGTLLLSGTGSINNSSGITVNGGTFKNNSSVNLTAPLTVISGTVGGNNLAGVALTVGTGITVSPGNSPGTMTAGATTFANGGSYLFEINNAGGTAGTNWDLLNASSLSITATSGGFTVNVASLVDPTNAAGSASGFDPSVSQHFLFVDTGSAITSFAGTAFTVDTTNFTNTYTGTWEIALGDTVSGGDNTQLYVTYTAIPEPSSYAALAGFGAIGLALYRRRRTSQKAA